MILLRSFRFFLPSIKSYHKNIIKPISKITVVSIASTTIVSYYTLSNVALNDSCSTCNDTKLENSRNDDTIENINNLNSIKPKILFVLGGPGAGKGTQCEKIVNKYDFVHLSAGDLLRAERLSGSSNGDLIDKMIREGEIVPVEITLNLIYEAMKKTNNKLFLIDGFPRNSDNVQGWENKMNDKTEVMGVLFYDCPENIMEKRLLERGKTSGRTDDNIEAIRKRFQTYLKSTIPVIKYYEKYNKVFRIIADKTPDEVFQDTEKIIEPFIKDYLLEVYLQNIKKK